MSQHNITSWHHIHGDGCLQTPIISDYQFNLLISQLVQNKSAMLKSLALTVLAVIFKLKIKETN